MLAVLSCSPAPRSKDSACCCPLSITAALQVWSPEGEPTAGGDVAEIIRRNQGRLKEGALARGGEGRACRLVRGSRQRGAVLLGGGGLGKGSEAASARRPWAGRHSSAQGAAGWAGSQAAPIVLPPDPCRLDPCRLDPCFLLSCSARCRPHRAARRGPPHHCRPDRQPRAAACAGAGDGLPLLVFLSCVCEGEGGLGVPVCAGPSRNLCEDSDGHWRCGDGCWAQTTAPGSSHSA